MNKANTNTKKKILGIGAGICALSLAAVSSFALFTDTASTKGATTAGKLAVGITADKMTDAGDFSEQLLNTDFAEEVSNLNPADVRTIEYTISSKQSKSLRASDCLTVTVTPDAKMMADQNKTVDDLFAEFTDKAAIHLVTGAKDDTKQVVTASDGTTTDVTFEDSGLTLKDAYVTEGKDAIVLVYQGDEVNLDGVGDNAEKIPGNNGKTTSARKYTLYFDETAGNQWQGAQVSIGSTVSAVQYANTAAGDAVLNVDATSHTVANDAGAHKIVIAQEGVKTNAAGKVND